MRAENVFSEILMSNGVYLKNPYVRDGRRIEDPGKITTQIFFDLCVEEDFGHGPVEKIIESVELGFNRYSQQALIMVNGVEVDFIQHIQAGGEFIEQDMTSFGWPPSNKLDLYFVDSFGAQLSFVEGPMTWFFKLWGLKMIKFDNKSLQELGFQWADE